MKFPNNRLAANSSYKVREVHEVMKKFHTPLFLLSSYALLLLGVVSLAFLISISKGDSLDNTSPWQQKRSLDSFKKLLERSPFSLPTAEENSPLADRYTISGYININGDDQLFIVDKNDQTHDIVTKIPNKKGMVLLNMEPSDNPNEIKASIQVGGETGVISSNDDNNDPESPQGRPPISNNTYPGATYPGLNRYPSLPTRANNMPPYKRPGYPLAHPSYPTRYPTTYPPRGGVPSRYSPSSFPNRMPGSRAPAGSSFSPSGYPTIRRSPLPLPGGNISRSPYHT